MTIAVDLGRKATKQTKQKLCMISALEAEANLPVERTIKMPEDDVLYCTYMLDKYGDDYKVG